MSDDVAANNTNKPDEVAAATENSSRLDAADKPSAYITIENEMNWWANSAKELYELAMQFLKDHENLHRRSNAGHLTAVIKTLAEYKKNAVDAASKLIAFQSPKLSNIELNSEVQHKFVIAAPPVFKNNEEWLAHVRAEQKLIELKPVIDGKPN